MLPSSFPFRGVCPPVRGLPRPQPVQNRLPAHRAPQPPAPPPGLRVRMVPRRARQPLRRARFSPRAPPRSTARGRALAPPRVALQRRASQLARVLVALRGVRERVPLRVHRARAHQARPADRERERRRAAARMVVHARRGAVEGVVDGGDTRGSGGVVEARGRRRLGGACDGEVEAQLRREALAAREDHGRRVRGRGRGREWRRRRALREARRRAGGEV